MRSQRLCLRLSPPAPQLQEADRGGEQQDHQPPGAGHHQPAASLKVKHKQESRRNPRAEEGGGWDQHQHEPTPTRKTRTNQSPPQDGMEGKSSAMTRGRSSLVTFLSDEEEEEECER